MEVKTMITKLDTGNLILTPRGKKQLLWFDITYTDLPAGINRFRGSTRTRDIAIALAYAKKQIAIEYEKQREKREAGVYNMSGLIGYVPLVDFITYMLYLSRTIIGYHIPSTPYEDGWVFYRKQYLDDLLDYQKALDKGEIYKDFDEYIYATHWRK